MKRLLALAVMSLSATIGPAAQPALDKTAQQWVDATLKKLTIEQLVGQMIFAPLNSTYLSSDSDQYEGLVKLVHESQIGGLIAFGGTEPVPNVLLNNTYGPIILGHNPPAVVEAVTRRLSRGVPLGGETDDEYAAAKLVTEFARIAGRVPTPVPPVTLAEPLSARAREVLRCRLSLRVALAKAPREPRLVRECA